LTSVDVHGIRVLLMVVLVLEPKHLGKGFLFFIEASVREFAGLEILELLGSGGFYPISQGHGYWGGVLDDSDVEQAGKAFLEHLKGTVLCLLISGKGQEFLEGGDVGVEIATLHFEGVDGVLCLDFLAKVGKGGVEGGLEVGPVLLGLDPSSICYVVVKGVLLVVSPVLYVGFLDVAEAERDALVGLAEY
jgi:hypothetical protein